MKKIGCWITWKNIPLKLILLEAESIEAARKIVKDILKTDKYTLTFAEVKDSE